MNRRASGLPLSKRFTGFLQHKAAEGLSPRTLLGYEHHLQVWLTHTGDLAVEDVSTREVRAFLAWLVIPISFIAAQPRCLQREAV